MSMNGKVHEAPEQLHMAQVTTLETLIECWPFVKKGIERIKARDKSCGNWSHNQIFNAIRFGLPTAQPKTTAVELYLALDATNRMKGFMVTTPKIDPFMNNVPIGIIVWLLYADFNMIQQFLPSLERLAKQNGGDVIEFQSGRLGWLRNFGRMKRLGFEVFQYTYRRNVKW